MAFLGQCFLRARPSLSGVLEGAPPGLCLCPGRSAPVWAAPARPQAGGPASLPWASSLGGVPEPRGGARVSPGLWISFVKTTWGTGPGRARWVLFTSSCCGRGVHTHDPRVCRPSCACFQSAFPGVPTGPPRVSGHSGGLFSARTLSSRSPPRPDCLPAEGTGAPGPEFRDSVVRATWCPGKHEYETDRNSGQASGLVHGFRPPQRLPTPAGPGGPLPWPLVPVCAACRACGPFTRIPPSPRLMLTCAPVCTGLCVTAHASSWSHAATSHGCRRSPPRGPHGPRAVNGAAQGAGWERAESDGRPRGAPPCRPSPARGPWCGSDPSSSAGKGYGS